MIAGGGSPPAALTVDETSPASITEDAPTPTPYAVAIVTLTPTVTDEEVGASVDEYAASWASPIIVDVAAFPDIVTVRLLNATDDSTFSEFKLTRDEYNEIAIEAAVRGLSVDTWIRQKILLACDRDAPTRARG